MNVKVELDTANEMLAKRGLNSTGPVQKYFTMACAREMDPYVPMSAGAAAHMKNQRITGQDTVTYPGTYSRFQYNGKLMVSPSGSSWARFGERKEVTPADLDYHGAPKRGAFWDKRMWADKKSKILRETAKMAGGSAQT